MELQETSNNMLNTADKPTQSFSGNICGSEIVTTTATDCSEVQSQGHNCSGIYRIQPSANIVVDVMCELSLDSGRWTVIQKRQDGSVDFYLDWAKYKNGFGNPFTEYWIGNEALYALTQFGKKELLILMETWDGVWKHARYSDFCISSEIDQYRLTLSGYTGTSGDSLLNTAVPQSGQKFSTRDRDNDGFAGSCNPDYHPGGWWFKNCGRSDLNGFYYSSAVHADNSCHWWSLTNNARVSLKTIRMMVRKV